jgi:hypothetical protein
MTSKEYVKGAIRTESGRFDAQHVDPETIKAAMTLFVAAGQALDVIKRGLFYGKPIDEVKLQAAFGLAEVSLRMFYGGPPIYLAGYSTTPVVNPRLVHAALGLGTESAEIIEKVMKSLSDGSDFDFANFFEELGDQQWYTALGIDTASEVDHASDIFAHPQLPDPAANGFRNWSYEAIWEKNLAKLKARYPSKFETKNAFERDLSKEQQALEGRAEAA